MCFSLLFSFSKRVFLNGAVHLLQPWTQQPQLTVTSLTVHSTVGNKSQNETSGKKLTLRLIKPGAGKMWQRYLPEGNL